MVEKLQRCLPGETCQKSALGVPRSSHPQRGVKHWNLRAAGRWQSLEKSCCPWQGLCSFMWADRPIGSRLVPGIKVGQQLPRHPVLWDPSVHMCGAKRRVWGAVTWVHDVCGSRVHRCCPSQAPERAQVQGKADPRESCAMHLPSTAGWAAEKKYAQ